MRKQTDRRSFLKKIGIGSIGAGVMPSALMQHQDAKATTPKNRQSQAKSQKEGRQYNGAYVADYLNRVAFPIGGLGSGMYCLEGSGAISHMSVRNKPDIFNEPGIFGAIAIKGTKPEAKIIEGPSPDWKRFGQPNSGNGSGGSIFGLPRFGKASFLARFPFGQISLEDKDFPLKVEIKGWSPFIPTDADNSSLPAGALEYKFMNKGNTPADCVFSFHVRNFMKHTDGGKNSVKKLENGFILSNEGTTEKPFLKGEFAICSDQENTIVDHCWFRGGWFDPLTITWDTIRSASVKGNDPVDEAAPGASLYDVTRRRKNYPGNDSVVRPCFGSSFWS